jgi:chromosome segregation ATPase
LAYDGERADAQVLDQLETILRHVADELAGWRARAVKAEGELKESGGRSGGPAAKPDPETRNRLADLEQENKALRQRVETARGRVHDLLSRLTFLEEQAREAGGNGSARAGGATRAGAGGAGGPGGAAGGPGSAPLAGGGAP